MTDLDGAGERQSDRMEQVLLSLGAAMEPPAGGEDRMPRRLVQRPFTAH
ncbi:hypothetical protein ACL90Y_02800 [Micrococcus luteus]